MGKDHRQETFCRNLELQVVPQDRRWRSIHCVNTRRRCHGIDASTIERDCGGLEGWAGFFRLAFAGVWDRTLRRVRVRTTKLLPRGAQNKAILQKTPSSKKKKKKKKKKKIKKPPPFPKKKKKKKKKKK